MAMRGPGRSQVWPGGCSLLDWVGSGWSGRFVPVVARRLVPVVPGRPVPVGLGD